MSPNAETPIKLIINADDFGLSEGINKAIIEAYSNGILTSTSICACGECFTDAVNLAKDNIGLDIGIHFILVGEKPLSENKLISSLVNNDGIFHSDAAAFTKKYFQKQINYGEVKLELNAQLNAIRDTGLKITHIDSHQHIHTLPGIFKIVNEIARENGINHIRFPDEKLKISMLKNLDKYPRLLQQIVLKMICNLNKRHNVNIDNFYGFFHGGNLNKNNLSEIVSNLKESTTNEIMCHPAVLSLNEKYDFWQYNHEEELKALLDSEIRNLISEKNIHLTNFSKL